MVELDVADHEEVRVVVQELRPLVEEGRVVLVPFHDGPPAPAQPPRAPTTGTPPISTVGSSPQLVKTWATSAVVVVTGCLPARNSVRRVWGIGNRKPERNGREELGVVLPGEVSDDHPVDSAREIPGVEPWKDVDAEGRKAIGHRGIEREIRA